MKKWLLVLGMVTCMFGLTACGRQEDKADVLTTQEAQQFAESYVTVISEIVAQQSEENYIAYLEQSGMDSSAFKSAFESWKSALGDMGNYVEIIGVAENSMEKEVVDGASYAVEGTVTVKIKGEVRDANVEIVYEDGMPLSITTNVEYTFGEIMEKAALNTLLGMGTVFIVLILISAIISCFGVIPKIQDKLTKKSKTEDVKSVAVNNTAKQIVEDEELADDLELVAVISAAIAASEGASSADGFVVRSIRRAGSKWQRA